MDMKMWLQFLEHPSVYNRSFIDIEGSINSMDVDFYSDATANPELGCGGISENDWYILQWDEDFIKKYEPSINYLELYAVAIAVFNWIHKYRNQKIFIFCDNMSVVQMINNNSSKCKSCMLLIRIIVLKALTFNVKINAKHIAGVKNNFSDLLSRMQYHKFRTLARKIGRKFNGSPSPIPEELWPMSKVWSKEQNKTGKKH